MNPIELTVLDKINQSIANKLTDEQFSVDALCKEVGLSRSRLHRVLIEETGLSTTLYIRKSRLDRGKALLSTTDLRISEIADAVGIGSPQNFSKYFTDEFDIFIGDFELAHKHFSKAVTLDPLSVINQLSAAFCYWWEGDLDECMAQVEKVIQFKPYLWTGYYTKSLVLLERFQFDELLPTIAKARQLYPSCLTLCFQGIAFVFSGQLAKANEIIAELEANPDKYPIFHHDIGQFYIALGNLEKGLYHWNLALEQHDGRMLFINTFFRKAKFFKSHPQFARFFREIEEVSIRAATIH